MSVTVVLTVRDLLQGIYDEYGELTPDLVVRVARPPEHPLHSRVFDRKPSEAAEAWYRHRAHELIQKVKVVYREADDSGPERRVRAFVPVQSADSQAYKYEPVEVAAQNPLTRTLVLQMMEREWKQLYSRYETFQEFIELVRRDLGEEAV